MIFNLLSGTQSDIFQHSGDTPDLIVLILFCFLVIVDILSDDVSSILEWKNLTKSTDDERYYLNLIVLSIP